jgi:hypothetical protein
VSAGAGGFVTSGARGSAAAGVLPLVVPFKGAGLYAPRSALQTAHMLVGVLSHALQGARRNGSSCLQDCSRRRRRPLRCTHTLCSHALLCLHAHAVLNAHAVLRAHDVWYTHTLC